MVEEQRPAEEAPTPEARPRVVRSLWRVGRWVLPLAVTGSIGYFAGRPAPKPERTEPPAPIAGTPTPGPAKPIDRTKPQHDFPIQDVTEREEVDTPSARFVFYQPKGVSCAGCHDMKELGRRQADEILSVAKDAQGIYDIPGRMPLSKNYIAFHPVVGQPEGQVRYADPFHKFDISLPAYTAGRRRNDATLREFVHYFDTMPDHLISEPWAWAAPYLLKPRDFKDITDPARPGAANRFSVGLLSRAAFLSGTVLSPREHREPLPEDPKEQAEYYRRAATPYLDEVQAPDVEGLGDVWKQAKEEYDRNDVYWDAVARANGNDPFVVVDTLFAQRAFRAAHPEFIEAYNDPAVVEAAKQLLKRNMRVVEDADEASDQFAAPFPRYGDTRDAFHRILVNLDPKLNRQKRDYRYLAFLARSVLNPDGTFNYEAIPAKDLRGIARDKMLAIDKVTSVMGEQDKRFLKDGDRSLARGIEERLRIFAQRRRELARAVERSNYLNIHER